jgi:hypothetical protein
MAQFLSGAELASYLGRPVSGTLDNIADRANALVTEEWTANVVSPPPEWVKNIAWDVAVRAGANPKGLTSETRSWDDATRTERWEAAGRIGVYLTDDELDRLQGRPTGADGASVVIAKSIRMRVPGWGGVPGWGDSQCRY